MWKTEKEMILVLKAHYMGRMFVNKEKNIQSILDSVNFAINELEHRNEKKDKIRQLFYIFLKIEILRDSQDVIDLRKRAKEIYSKEMSPVIVEQLYKEGDKNAIKIYHEFDPSS